MKRNVLVSFVSILILGGCQSIPGKLPDNEFTFNSGRTSTKNAIIKTFRSRDYHIVRNTQSELVMDRPASDSVRAQLIYGSRQNGAPDARVILTFSGDNPTRVRSVAQIVTSNGRASGRIVDMSQNAEAREAIARGMDEVKKTLDKK
ncbi:hypothetical protein DKP76_05060 [Falsochrobactrum shanghaiense]|uniref:Lipoprotein n=1 Tax=Falsochrobactrum shanghaiense TaxID=2201899 RepID=A0A316JT67_9HYPH|nr:hypothetical protein [Falsochrobactrum shanghaiense]PWL18470.1 hypothetical protein DKP76_05060 [Falsochrobactrum shanghaiense]